MSAFHCVSLPHECFRISCNHASPLYEHMGEWEFFMFCQSCHQMKKAELLEHLNREGKRSQVLFVSSSVHTDFNSTPQKAYSVLWFIVIFLICVSASVICCWHVLKPSKDVNKTQENDYILFLRKMGSNYVLHFKLVCVSPRQLYCQNSYCFFWKYWMYIWMCWSL